jgi:hypothetical protein
VTKEIILSKNKTAIVDNEDYDWLNQWKWCAYKAYNTYYACRNTEINGKKSMIQMHREILGLQEGDNKLADHKDRNGLNNRRNNLRVVSRSLNSHNCKKLKNNTSGFRGVHWNKPRRKWIVQITINGVKKHYGCFDSPIEAAKCYDRKVIETYGLDAVTNFPIKEED